LPGLPDFSWYNIPKTGIPTDLPNVHKTYQMAIKYTNIFHFKILQNLPKLGFLVLEIFHLTTLTVTPLRWTGQSPATDSRASRAVPAGAERQATSGGGTPQRHGGEGAHHQGLAGMTSRRVFLKGSKNRICVF
jgi:hypothetical protein